MASDNQREERETSPASETPVSQDPNALAGGEFTDDMHDGEGEADDVSGRTTGDDREHRA